MRLRAMATAAMMLAAACTARSYAEPRETGVDIAASVFLRKESGWVLSSMQPAYPYNSEPEPRLDGLSGAAGPRPFGCGLTFVESSYFSGSRGRLGCILRASDGRLNLHTIQRNTKFSRVYDATAVGDGYAVLAEVSGRTQARVFFIDADGQVIRSADAPTHHPDQAVILPTGRIAVLERRSGGCDWRLLQNTGQAYVSVTTTPADHVYQCQSSSTGGDLIRDQITGQAYLAPRHPQPDVLYRIDDNGDALPATQVAADFSEGVDAAGSDRGFVTIIDGAVYFSTSTPAGPIIGRHDLTSGETSRTDLRAASGRWQDAGQVYGLMTAPGLGPTPRAAVMDRRSGVTEVVALTR